MVSEATIKNNFRKAIESFKTDKYRYHTNRGGYPVKVPVYDISDEDISGIQSNLKYGEVYTDGDFTDRKIICVVRDPWVYIEYPLLFHACDPCDITQIDEHHTYGTTMKVDGAVIEKILKQSEKAVYVRMLKPSGFRYERWLPKSTIYEIKRELEVGGVVSKYTQLYKTWQVVVLGNTYREKTYADEEHYIKRINSLVEKGCELVSEKDIDGVMTAYIYDEAEKIGVIGCAKHWGEEYVKKSDISVYNQKWMQYHICWDIVEEKGLDTKEHM